MKYLAAAIAALCILLSSTPASSSYLFKEKANQIVLLRNSLHRGTGFELRVGTKVYTLTNRHVCGGSTDSKMEATIDGAPMSYELKILYVGLHVDLCVLEAVPAATGLELAPAYFPREHVFILGHPMGGPLTETEGELLARDFTHIRYDDFECELGCMLSYETVYSNAKVLPGNSGSPAMDDMGYVIGVVVAMDTNSGPRHGNSYIITLGEVAKFLLQMSPN